AAIAAIATLPVFMPCSLRWNEGPRIGSGHGKSNEVKHIHHGGTPYVVVLQASRHKGASFAQHGGTRKRMALASRGPSAEKYMSNSTGCVVMRKRCTSSYLSS